MDSCQYNLAEGSPNPVNRNFVLRLSTYVLFAVIAIIALLILRRMRRIPGLISVPPSRNFDYIIVGGGLAGSVLAARLSEDISKSVLVIESGTANPNNLFIRISGAILKLFRNPAFDWCWQTIAEAGCHGRHIFLCRGKLLGGSTCLNAQIALRGCPRDYDGWGEYWSSDDITCTFDSIVSRNHEPMSSCAMHVQLPCYQHELSKRFLDTCNADGADIHPDLKKHCTDFNDWNAAAGDSINENSGFGRFELSQRNGTRWTSASSYLAVAMSRPNVTVLTGHTASQVVLSSADGALTASGVALKNVTARERAARKSDAQVKLKRVLAKGVQHWQPLREQLEAIDVTTRSSFSTIQVAGYAAAHKLITNHEAVLRDATDPEPLTQLHLIRIAASAAEDVDIVLRVVAHKLLGTLSNTETTLPQNHWPRNPEQASVWMATAKYLQGRLHTKPERGSGRSLDMSEQAGEALCMALRAVSDSAASLLSKTANASEEKIPCQAGGAFESVATVRLKPGGEVLLAAGALGSPQVLQLSGIGDPSVLKAAGVPLLLTLPAVGEGLQDHAAVTVAYESRIADGMSEIKPLMPWLNVLSPIALYKWLMHGSGILSTTFCDHGAFLRSSEDLVLPDVQLRFVPGIGPAADGVKSYELLGKGIQHKNYGFTLQVINCRPKSLGCVRVVSSDPVVAPEIRCNYLERPEDLRALSTGITVARCLAKSGKLAEISMDEVYPGAGVQSDDDLDAYIRSTLHSANGISGGCCIGQVVDSQLKVKGVVGLRVVDASVMPQIPGAQLALPTAMIAERAALLIKHPARP